MKTRHSSKRIDWFKRVAVLITASGLSVGAANAQNQTPPATPRAPSAQTQPTAARDTVTGTVRTPDGKPVKDAAVFWIGRTPNMKTISDKVERRFTADTDATGPLSLFRAAAQTRHVVCNADGAGTGVGTRVSGCAKCAPGCPAGCGHAKARRCAARFIRGQRGQTPSQRRDACPAPFPTKRERQ